MSTIIELQRRRNDILTECLPVIRKWVTKYLFNHPCCRFLADDLLQSAILQTAKAIDYKLAKCPDWKPEDGGFAWKLIAQHGMATAQRTERVIQSPRVNQAKRVTPPTYPGHDADDWFNSVEVASEPDRNDLPIKLVECCRTDAEALVMLALMARVKIADIAEQLKMTTRAVRATKSEIGRRILAKKSPAPSGE